MRFPKASVIRYQLHRLFVTAMLAVAALALLGKVARAEAPGHEPQARASLVSPATLG